ncbi:E3 ubiquitin-protein ligase SHPRH [Heracleum sosnowskyi]|uniref:E3 ubiquitin-protein ligase SHPRH n=1 Tax=Heracleum sosnowskyi TaxID=360622 RepID=A0AAD8ILZ2_9APIA|nr:E3 ubiquitin-protein ligase SHPRH [Heracleum sosnowskyi]
MGRKKHRPHRSVGISHVNILSEESKLESGKLIEDKVIQEPDVPFYVQVDSSSWNSVEHYDIAEIVLTDLDVSEEFSGYVLSEEFYREMKYLLRFRLVNVGGNVGRMKLGHGPVLSRSDIYLELVEKRVLDDGETDVVLLTGSFDGPDEGVSGLVHLAGISFLTLRPVVGVTLSERCSSLRMRVGILKSAFDACESLFDNTRGLWRRSMMRIMAWLRPEVITSESRYGYSAKGDEENGLAGETDESSVDLQKRKKFDAAGFYEAIKPSKKYPMLEDMPDLLPKLRPYQRRAAYWMVQREKGGSEIWGEKERDQFVYPLCTPVNLIDSCSTMFYNSFSGSVSLHPDNEVPYVSGGILADEMGLGKTVEVLACIFAHRKASLEDDHVTNDIMQVSGDQNINIKRIKKERVECVCGAVSDSSKYEGLWVQCDICDAWQHADCVGYLTDRSQNLNRSKRHSEIVEEDEAHICKMCSELLLAAGSPIATGATLIVCPAPILPQWHSEINRHTRSGSLKICVYEGVRNTSTSNTSLMDIGELLSADIVLTTYDVLKDDLSHDSDRHEGDRHFMRFQKRYPVIPTSLTRLLWWRICLDEAQMVESNVAAATEMALRLHARNRWCITGTPIQRKLDDLYGLLKFLKASPYDIIRWWTEVIRDPYENGDAGAMVFTQNFFKHIMWRSSKVYISEELQIPPQEERVSWISLSPIEENFYQRQYDTCVGYAREIMLSFKEDLLKRNVSGSKSYDALSHHVVTHVEAAKLLNSLLKLRQACCHPQVGSSGLRSLQQSPMTMEEILSVLVGKTKLEGEEALRRLVVSLNALAAIAVIKQEFSQSVLLYKEALTVIEEHSEDFRVDPLLNIHLHHNLAEILPLTADFINEFHSDCECLETAVDEMLDEARHEPAFKKMKLSKEKSSDLTVCRSKSNRCLRLTSDNLKKKFLSVFNSKLSLAQAEFRKSHVQVDNIVTEKKNEHMTWWLDTLHYVEQNKETSSELIRKIGEAISGTLNTSKTSRISSCFQSITALKYYLQTTLDSLEDSRKYLLDGLMEIDNRMGNPRVEDIERVRYCPNCYSGDGVMCVHCELDELFQVYEARLFRLNKGNAGGLIASAEEAVDQQKKKSALNQFYWKLSQAGKSSTSATARTEDDGKKRDAGEKVVVTKSPSDVEVILGIIKSYSKASLGREATEAAIKHVLLLEGMRKEYVQARSLATAQAQVLRAHDEIKMATSRLRLRENEDDNSVDALTPADLDPASVEYSSEKFVALSTISSVKGQLRYLKGLVHSKQIMKTSSLSHDKEATVNAKENACFNEDSEETCPVCQEKLSNRKMVFQCGHITCCKCLFAMIDQRRIQCGGFQSTWVHCPTCRIRTDYGNIAYVDDGQQISSLQNSETSPEDSINVQGSYSTKVEAVTKRILWIKSTTPEAKVLVFSSWNDVLDVLQHAFVANNITFIRMQGGRRSHIAINRFRGERSSLKGSGLQDCQPEIKPIQVLLILVQHGANGLNLLEAQHVILVEPLLNPAAELQAISRVHRIGQENKTIVHRFIVQNTVEESIYKLNKSRTSSSYISANKKNLDQPVLTLRDLESLFRVAPPSEDPESIEKQSGSLSHLPPSLAAAVAAERRLMERTS